jgi:putative ABC transport system permease protein
MQEIGSALRGLARKPGFAVIAIVTLALGIGANAAIFSVVDAVLLRPLPYRDSDRLVMPWAYSAEVHRRVGFDRLPSSPGDVTDFIARNRTFESLAWMRAERLNITGGGEPERVAGVRVSRNFFYTLGVEPVHGRAFSEVDGAGGRTVLIGHDLWRRRFAGDPDVLNRVISINAEPATIVGVLPHWFRFPAAGELPAGLGYAPNPDVWTLDILTPEMQRSRGGKSFALVGRLRDGISAQMAESDLAGIAADIGRQFPASNAGWTIKILPLREQLVGGLRTALMVLLAAGGFVLLIACANVANLLLVRATTRQREVSVRYALGADRRRVFRQLLLESVVLSLLAGIAGVVLAIWSIRVLLAMLPTGVPAVANVTVDWRVVAFTVVISAIAGIVFGIGPALHATRLDVTLGLREGARGTLSSRRAHRARNALVVVEVALAAVLLIAASLLIQTFVRLLNVNTGFRTDGVLTMEVALPRTIYPGARPADFFGRLIARLEAVPGVESAGLTSSLPLSGLENLRQVTIEGRPRPAPGAEIISDYRVVTSGFFRTMGIPHLSGDSLTAPAPGNRPMLLINSRMADIGFAGDDPVGRRIKLTNYDQEAPWFTIAGVVGDTRHTALTSDLRPQVYVHHDLDPVGQMVVVMRTGDDPAGYAAVARAAVHEIDADQPVGRIRSMKTVVSEAVAQQRFTMCLVGMFAALALGLSLLGLYAVVSYSVAERTPELGVRLALGATPVRLLLLVLTDGISLVAVGVVLGLAGAFGLVRLIESQLFGVRAHDPQTFVVVPLLLVAAAVLGCLIPARRAMQLDPTAALRSE